MIHRSSTEGQKLDVAGLNEITVLIDRSETELTEVAMNSWSPGLDGPPHAHEHKEQMFFVTAGRGSVKIGPETFPAQPGDLFYVPAGTRHQTINETQQRLEYFLYNGFLDENKEGHASFADHIAKVKETRREQAAAQRADVAGAGTIAVDRAGKRIRVSDAQISGTLLDRGDTQRAEAEYLSLHATVSSTIHSTEKEQVLYVLSGSAKVATASIRPRDILFVARGERVQLDAGPEGLRAISFGTVISR
jgi:mannose-6-phosphate isomerase-like protein (cupin superfamily)